MTESAYTNHLKFMKLAIEQANLCEPVETAYSVGAVLIDSDNKIISTGYSRELPGNTHAEESAFLKLEKDKDYILESSTLYTTMEPCSKRLSGKTSCTDWVLKLGIKNVVIGITEPDNFVTCEGVLTLQNKGVNVVRLGELEEECKKPNLHLLSA